ncbi:MAG: histidine kinase [Ferruginibacter sp.]
MKKSFVIALHFGYWLLYLLLLTLIVIFLQAGTVKPLTQGYEKMWGFIKVLTAITLLPALAGFYTFYFLLFHRFLSTKKIWALCIWGLITILLCGGLSIISLGIISLGKVVVNSNIGVVISLVLFVAVLSLVHGIIALVVKGFITWYGDIKIKEQLQQQHFETELALVKSQLNPHFLFNTINNIDVLITKDAAKASAYLNKLSDIMRFMLYETKAENIPLQKELAYIEKYIDLQKIRTANNDFIQYEVDCTSSNWQIAPMLFVPFIENAFKHAANKKTGSGIVVKIKANEKELQFYCYNDCNENPLSKQEPGGLGNSLIQKRLQLLYPGKHNLQIKKENDIFKVHLTIFAHGH